MPSNKEFEIRAYHVMENMDIKSCREKFNGTILSESKTDLFFAFAEGKYVFLFSYGVAVFYNMAKVEIAGTFKLLFPQKDMDSFLYDEFRLKNNISEEIDIQFNSISLKLITQETIKIVMLNMAQSLALVYYDQVSQDMLYKVRQFTTQMEDEGTLKINRKDIMRFIGKTLNTRNKIAENLYIFDAPPITWDDEYLDKVNTTLSRHFDLGARFRSIENTFTIVGDNLKTYLEIYHQKESSKLEWIIIILILVEVIDTFVSKLL